MNATKENPLERSYRVALYSSLNQSKFNCVFALFGPIDKGIREGFVRISDIVEMRFPALSSDEVIQQAVQSLDAAELAAREECNRKVAAIREQKAQLLAITHQPEPLA